MNAGVVGARSIARRLTVFNHKGGVGKTTLTTNVALALAALGKRVLLVDSDPQCNLTSYLVDDMVVDKLLDESDTPDGRTLWSALKPIAEATGDPLRIEPLELREHVFLIPGDVRLAEFEQELHNLWGECFQRRPRGFRGTTALSQVVNEVAQRYEIDFVFYDSGPNIGALNRVILLDCDYFAIPAACDLFSVRAIKTLGHTLSSWVRSWRTVADLAPDGAYLFPGEPKLLGYIPQRFRVYRERPASEYARFLPLIEKAVRNDVVAVMSRVDPTFVPKQIDNLKLGEVKDFASMANASQSAGVAIGEVVGISQEQKDEANATFRALAAQMISRTGG